MPASARFRYVGVGNDNSETALLIGCYAIPLSRHFCPQFEVLRCWIDSAVCKEKAILRVAELAIFNAQLQRTRRRRS